MHEIRCGDMTFAPSKLICVGRNFLDHAREMGARPPSEPVIFLKPNSAIASCPTEVFIPEAFGELHHEVELCALLGDLYRDASPEDASRAIKGYAVGIDFTLRQMQAEAKEAGLPWALSKGFDDAAALGCFVPSQEVGAIMDQEISLAVNGEERQRASLNDMIFTPADILSHVSLFMTIEEGDLLMCGTPAGVGPVRHDDCIAARIGDALLLECRLLRRR